MNEHMFKQRSKVVVHSSRVILLWAQDDNKRGAAESGGVKSELEKLARYYQPSLISCCQLCRSYLHNTFTPRLWQERRAMEDNSCLQPRDRPFVFVPGTLSKSVYCSNLKHWGRNIVRTGIHFFFLSRRSRPLMCLPLFLYLKSDVSHSSEP